MWVILAFIGVSFFILGLLQWARSGAGLWRIMDIRRGAASLTEEERKEAEGEVRRLEQATDRALFASLRIIGFLAAALWLILGVTIVLDLLGIDWMHRTSTRARTYWHSMTTGTSHQRPSSQNDVLKNLGGGLRK